MRSSPKRRRRMRRSSALFTFPTGARTHLAAAAAIDFMDEKEKPYDGAGFPGCGDGSDDLADYNQNEGDDYQDE